MADVFLNFIDEWGYFVVALLMGLENACVKSRVNRPFTAEISTRIQLPVWDVQNLKSRIYFSASL